MRKRRKTRVEKKGRNKKKDKRRHGKIKRMKAIKDLTDMCKLLLHREYKNDSLASTRESEEKKSSSFPDQKHFQLYLATHFNPEKGKVSLLSVFSCHHSCRLHHYVDADAAPFISRAPSLPFLAAPHLTPSSASESSGELGCVSCTMTFKSLERNLRKTECAMAGVFSSHIFLTA